MSEIEQYLSEFGKIIVKEIERKVKEIVAEMIMPIVVLRAFDDVEVLTLEEMADVLRKPPAIVREACKRGELPHTVLGKDYIFPKRLVADYLLGNWRKEKKSKGEKIKSLSKNEAQIERFVR